MISLAEIKKIDILNAYERFYAACDLDIGLSVVEWICQYTYLNGEPFSFRGFEYLIQPVNDMYPRQAVVKPAQKGASEAMARKMFAVLYKHSLTPHYYEENNEEHCIWGINGIYSFPNVDDVRKFSKDRLLTDIINPAPDLHIAMKHSQSEACDQIGINNSFCYLTGRRTDAGVQSIPAELVFIDEYDRPLVGDMVDKQSILASLKARVKNARIFGNEFFKGLVVGYATPTYPDEVGILIEGQYYVSDQHIWLIKCIHCNEYQEVIYPDSIAYFYEKGEKKPKKDSYWMCLKCKKPLDFSEIGKWDKNDPHKVHNAEWVARYPSRTKHGDGIRGYRIPFATLRDTAKQILSARDEDYKHSMQNFYNYGLGLAYRDNTIGISEEDFIRNLIEVSWGYYDNDYPHVMGIDQGCYIVVARLKEDSQTDINPKGVWQIMYCENPPENSAFSHVEKNNLTGERTVKKGRIASLIDYWNPEVVVIDHLPNTASSEQLAEEYKGIVWLNDSKGNFFDRIKFEKEDNEGNRVYRITENKHFAIDQLFDEIRNHKIEYAKNGGEEFSRLKSHCKNIKKITESNTFKYESFGADHYGQAMKYLSEAAELYSKLRPRITRIGFLGLKGFAIK